MEYAVIFAGSFAGGFFGVMAYDLFASLVGRLADHWCDREGV